MILNITFLWSSYNVLKVAEYVLKNVTLGWWIHVWVVSWWFVILFSKQWLFNSSFHSTSSVCHVRYVLFSDILSSTILSFCSLDPVWVWKLFLFCLSSFLRIRLFYLQFTFRLISQEKCHISFKSHSSKINPQKHIKYFKSDLKSFEEIYQNLDLFIIPV